VRCPRLFGPVLEEAQFASSIFLISWEVHHKKRKSFCPFWGFRSISAHHFCYALLMSEKPNDPPTGSAAHEDEIRRLARRLLLAITLKYSLGFATIWCFLWGTAALVLRAVSGAKLMTLLWGIFGILSAVLAAAFISRRQVPSRAAIRALLDQRNSCGGLLMAAGDAALGDWRSRMPAIDLPRIRWRNPRAWWVFAASILFLLASLAVPVRFASLNSPRALDVGREVNDLAEKIEALKEEMIIEEAKAEALEQKLEELGKEAFGDDPAKTWEALDHLAAAVEKTAKEAAQSEMAGQERLAQIEALAEGLMAGSDEMDSKLMTEAMQTLSEKMESAMRENRMLAQNLSPELQEAINSGALKPEHLKDISKALSQNRSTSDRKLSKLNEKRLIDLKSRAEAEIRDNSGLARFLQENAQRMSVDDAVAAWYERQGRGGISRGRGDAAMTWTDGTSEKNAKFKERELPPSFAAGLKDSQLVGLSASEPTVQKTLSAHGALIDAAKGGGSAHTATILPRHKGVVKRYFDRK
jgi:hypothetical protein